MSNDEKSAEPSRNLKIRTVAIIFGSVILLLTGVFVCVGGGWLALLLPLGSLAAVGAAILFQVTYQKVIFPVFAFVVLGAKKVKRLLAGK